MRISAFSPVLGLVVILGLGLSVGIPSRLWAGFQGRAQLDFDIQVSSANQPELNLIQNGSFNERLASWQSAGLVTDTNYESDSVAQFKIPLFNAHHSGSYLSQQLPYLTKVTLLSFKVKALTAEENSGFGEGILTVFVGDRPIFQWWLSDQNFGVKIQDEWQEIEIVLPPVLTTSSLKFFVNDPTGLMRETTILIDDIVINKLSEGNSSNYDVLTLPEFETGQNNDLTVISTLPKEAKLLAVPWRLAKVVQPPVFDHPWQEFESVQRQCSILPHYCGQRLAGETNLQLWRTQGIDTSITLQVIQDLGGDTFPLTRPWLLFP